MQMQFLPSVSTFISCSLFCINLILLLHLALFSLSLQFVMDYHICCLSFNSVNHMCQCGKKPCGDYVLASLIAGHYVIYFLDEI